LLRAKSKRLAVMAFAIVKPLRSAILAIRYDCLMRTSYYSLLLLSGLVCAGVLAGGEPASPPKLGGIANAGTSQSSADLPASALTEKEFAVKEAGTLHLVFPKTWTNSAPRTVKADKPFQSIIFTPPNGNDFAVMLEIITVGTDQAKNLDTKSVLAKAGQQELAHAVEKSLDIQNFEGIQTTGSYFTITDKDLTITRPLPDTFKYLTQGYAKLGSVVLSFRLVSNQPAGPEKKEVLDMIKTARLVSESPSGPGGKAGKPAGQ